MALVANVRAAVESDPSPIRGPGRTELPRRVAVVAACLGMASGCSDETSRPGAVTSTAAAGSSPTTTSSAGGNGAGGGGAAGGHAGAAGQAGHAGSGGGAVSVELAPITDHHRYVPGQMFGGWGPHLGHLVRAQASSGAGESLWFVDDYCSQSAGADACDVAHDHTIGYFEHTSTGWQLRDTVALPGQVQQNAATIAAPSGAELHTFGLDVSAHLLRQCSYTPAVGPGGCAALPFTLEPNSNYLGAAVAPAGHRLVWWTRVQDGGGGGFHYVIDYGGGWNGPRSGDVAGYNDASYINIGFGAASEAHQFTMHVQFVSGWAPNWDFVGAVGYGDMSTTDPVTWQNALAPVGSDAIVSTNDIWIDPATNDTHLVARTESGAAAYYHRPPGGSWSAPLFTLAATYRARFVYSADRLVWIYGPNGGDLAYRVAATSDRTAGQPISWSSLGQHQVALPAGFGRVIAIYPESPAYQNSAAQGIHAALVGDAEQHRVLHVAIQP